MTMSVADLRVEVAQGDLQTRYVELDELAMRRTSLPAGTDMAPVLQGLPGDHCPSPHWGIVLGDSITIEHADGSSETANAGEVYHWPAGHIGTSDNGAVFLGIGAVGPMREFSEHAKRLFAGSPA